MNKLLLITICMIMTLSANAQTEHLKFMGIPLDGGIASFHEQLEAKGARYDRFSDYMAPGNRLYNGTFFGKDAKIFVYYDAKTLIMYRAKAVIDYYSEDMVMEGYYTFKRALDDKYADAVKNNSAQGGYPSHLLTLYDNQSKKIGYISVYVTENKNEKTSVYAIHIDYEDEENTNKHRANIEDDL